MSYEIFTDASADIDREIVSKYNIGFVPMEYMVGEDSYTCKEQITDEAMHDFYERLRKKENTHTSQITPYNYVEFFKPMLESGKKVMYLALSSGLSNTYESAQMAAQMLKDEVPGAEIEMIDSLSATGGMGLLIELACKNREEGLSLAENAAEVREMASYVKHWFKVEDLMYLQRGGRVSAATAIVGTALNIKPILDINAEGKLDTIAKKRGTVQSLKHMLELFKEDFDENILDVVYISAADCPKDQENLKNQILEIKPNVKIRTTQLSPIIGAHTGPDMIALIYFGAHR